MPANLQQQYEVAIVGATNFVRCGGSDENSLASFQAVYDQAKKMELDGLIVIKDSRRESMTGKKFITIFQFEKIQ